MNIKAIIKKAWNSFIVDYKLTKNLNRILYFVGFCFLILIIVKNWNELFSIWKNANIIWLILVVVLYPIGMIPTTLAWHYILRSININLSYIKNLRYYSLSTFSRHIPGFVFFVGNRSLVYSSENISGRKIIFSTFLEILVLSLMGYFLSIPIIINNQSAVPNLLKILIIIFCSVSIIFISVFMFGYLRKNVNKEIKILKKNFHLPTIKLTQLSKSFVISIFAWIGGGLLLSFVVNSIKPINFSTLLFTIGVWAFVGSLSMSIGIFIQAIGFREISMAVLLSMIMNPIEAASIAVSFRLLFTLGEILWVFVFTLLIKPDKKIIMET